jgi:hypothetical protein
MGCKLKACFLLVAKPVLLLQYTDRHTQMPIPGLVKEAMLLENCSYLSPAQPNSAGYNSTHIGRKAALANTGTKKYRPCRECNATVVQGHAKSFPHYRRHSWVATRHIMASTLY